MFEMVASIFAKPVSGKANPHGLELSEKVVH